MAFGLYRVGQFNIHRRYVRAKMICSMVPEVHLSVLKMRNGPTLVQIGISTVVSQSNALPLSRARTLPLCRTLKQEKKDIRLAIMPLLQAEEDARYVKQVS
jgi:GRIM-19 protein